MKRLLKAALLGIALIIAAGFAYGTQGYTDAFGDAAHLRERANRLIAEGRSGDDLGTSRRELVLMVQDPAFEKHRGVDLHTPGAGITTVSQSLSKRLAFKQFQPGVAKIRQTGYALGLESRLHKDQILALWLDTLEMGRGPDGWMTGFFQASETVFERHPAELQRLEFLKLVAVLIAPGLYDLRGEDAALEERTARIARLVDGKCAPLSHGDVWLEGCR